MKDTTIYLNEHQKPIITTAEAMVAIEWHNKKAFIVKDGLRLDLFRSYEDKAQITWKLVSIKDRIILPWCADYSACNEWNIE